MLLTKFLLFFSQILVVDVCKEEGNTPYRLTDGTKHSPLQMIKRALTQFLLNKHSIDPQHKFALVVLHETPIWVSFDKYSISIAFKCRAETVFTRL